jgi:hypothetical protein
MENLLLLLLEKIQYDFCEDDEEVQGHWKIDTSINGDGTVRAVVEYAPFSDSPFLPARMHYRIERVW